jgi:HK97 gp10 family phage protein
MKTEVTIRGIEDVNRTLMMIAPREAKNLMRTTVHDMAGQLRKDAQARAPKDDGDLRKAIRHKRARGTRDRVQSDVVVERKAFYWRFLEYGQGPDGVEHAFFLKALQSLRGNIEAIYLRSFVKKLEARLARERRRRS